MKKTSTLKNLGFIGCFAALTACGAAPDDSFTMPPPPAAPLPEFTETEAGNIDITMAFLSCAIGSTQGITDPYLYEAILDICAQDTEFSFDVYGDIITQYAERYGNAWPHMVRDMFEERRMSLSM